MEKKKRKGPVDKFIAWIDGRIDAAKKPDEKTWIDEPESCTYYGKEHGYTESVYQYNDGLGHFALVLASGEEKEVSIDRVTFGVDDDGRAHFVAWFTVDEVFDSPIEGVLMYACEDNRTLDQGVVVYSKLTKPIMTVPASTLTIALPIRLNPMND